MTKEEAERNIQFAEYLRKPELKQAHGQLRDRNEGRCCLGHACDFMRAQTGRGEWRFNEIVGSTASLWSFKIDGIMASDLPPEQVSKWFGWPRLMIPNQNLEEHFRDPLLTIRDRVTGEPSRTYASCHNDTLERTLPEIAEGFQKLGEDGLANAGN